MTINLSGLQGIHPDILTAIGAGLVSPSSSGQVGQILNRPVQEQEFVAKGALDLFGLQNQQQNTRSDIDLRGQELDLKRMLGQGGLDIQNRGLDLQSLLGQGGLDLKSQGLDLQSLLGTGGLGIQQQGLGLQQQGLDLQRELGIGNLQQKQAEFAAKQSQTGKLKVEEAAKVQMIQTAAKRIPQIKKILFDKNGNVKDGTSSLLGQMKAFRAGIPGAIINDDAEALSTFFEFGIQAITRTETGAAMADSEIDKTIDRFVPGTFDSDSTIKLKIKAYNEFLNGILSKTGLTPFSNKAELDSYVNGLLNPSSAKLPRFELNRGL